ncbi:MAG: hypothetical protein AB1916_12485 [Thermodesulfobacteriota bacterium]
MPEREFARRPSRYYAAAAVFGLLCLGTLAVAANGLVHNPVLALAGLPVLPSLTAFALGFLSLARDPMPGLILLDQGLYDNAFLFPAGAVAWEDVAACTLRVKDAPAEAQDGRPRPQNRTLLLTLRDPAAFFAALPPATRLGRTLTLFALRRTIAIPEGFLAADLEEVRAAIQARLDERPPVQ